MLTLSRKGSEHQWSKQLQKQKKKTDGVAQKKTEGVGRTRAVRQKGQARVVSTLLKKVEQKLSEDDVKATLGDYIRLVQLQKELEEDETREIKVTWVEPETTESDSGK
jgi:hypothetical protein